MPEYAGDGRAITKQVQEAIIRAGLKMDLTSTYDHLPGEHRARIRAEETAALKLARVQGRNALEAWAKETIRDAEKVLGTNAVGTPAEETRKLAEQQRVARIVDQARSRGGNIRAAVQELGEQADAAWVSQRHDEAYVLAQAARELGSTHPMVAGILEDIQLDRDLADPARARALGSIRDVAVVVAAYDRDINAAYSKALRDSAKLASVLGEGGAAQDLTKESAEASVRAKLQAFYGGRAFGDGIYREPEGVNPGGPQNLDPRGTPQPEGARLPETRP